MFGLDPFNPSIVIAEMLLLLGFAALVGWLLGRLVLSGRVSALESSITRKEAELAECRRSKSTGVSAATPAYVPPRAESVAETPSAFVPADPLLPVVTQDTTPTLVAADAPDVPGMEMPRMDVNRAEMPVVEVPPMGAPIPEAPPSMDVPGMDVPGMEVPTILPPIAAPVVPVPSSADLSPTGNSEAAVLNRIAARVNELNFDRIGRATAAEADDLKDIIGVGPFLERKLHSLGIYTFRQVANFTKEDVAKVNDIIEFFPGRIERDNWVEQSRQFHERKYGEKR